MPRPDVRDQRIPQLLSAATAVFSEKGFDDGSMSQIAERAGVSKATIYHYFPAKDDLIIALVRSIFQLDIAQLVREEDVELPVRDRILGYARQLGQNLARNRDVYALINLAYCRAHRDDAVRRCLAEYFSAYTSALERLFEHAEARHELPAAFDSSRLASALIATIEGSLLMSSINGRDLPDALLEDVASYLDTITG